ncbi:permease-like cell division protein FtsX [Actinoplanes utahensis]|uniref:permease-like cell division protein FtsX n=1 Tax=Actinoplanes utahensis TaxID=1869 RepID=UPI000A73B3D2|nr:permease-like cell division protein FtsX [Actinoplanes utahensis]
MNALRPVHLVVSGVSALAGVAVTSAVLLLAGWRHLPVNDYEVRVFLDKKVTAEQTEAIRTTLAGLAADGQVRLRTPEQNYADYLRSWADSGETPPEQVTADSFPETLVIDTTGRDFDCTPYAEVKDDAGVDSVRIGQFDEDGRPRTGTEC